MIYSDEDLRVTRYINFNGIQKICYIYSNIYKEIDTLFVMKAQECVLPVKCANCGGMFDLWYYLLAQEEGREVAAEMAQEAAFVSMNQHLCWECRRERSDAERIDAAKDLLDEDRELNEELGLSWE